jgi:alanine-glyoxylate transaminase/serine-glyoxylate transaminase/serine-pyruvate transaminase
MDVGLLDGYYGGERVYHHTAPISAIYGLAEGLARVMEEGMEKRALRHQEAAEHLLERLAPLGFTPLVAAEYRLPMLTTLELPESVVERGEARVRRDLLDRHGIEVGAGLGALAGRVWRVGLMGENAREDAVDALHAALEVELGSTD